MHKLCIILLIGKYLIINAWIEIFTRFLANKKIMSLIFYFADDRELLAFRILCRAAESTIFSVTYLHMQQTASILTDSSGGVQSGNSGLRT